MSRRTLTAALVGIALLVGAVFVQSYVGREQLIDSQRAGCERAVLDRAASAEGWRTAENARRAAASNGGPNQATDARAAALYARIASGFEQRAAVDCDDAFPAASPWPWAQTAADLPPDRG